MKYAFFICLLFFMSSCALKNNTRELSKAFSAINEELGRNSYDSQQEYESLLKELKLRLDDNSDAHMKILKQVEGVHLISERLYLHIAALKEELTKGIKDPKDYSTMDKSVLLDTLLFKDEKFTEVGQSFSDLIMLYIEKMTDYTKETPQLQIKIRDGFTLGNRSTSQNFLEYEFKGFPLIASLTKLTQMQADIDVIKEQFLKNQIALLTHKP